MYLNNLCSDPLCLERRACAHIGPQNQFCYFDTEKELCSMMGIPWKQEYTLKYLLNELRFRLTGKEELPEDLPISLRSTDENVRDLEAQLKVVKG